MGDFDVSELRAAPGGVTGIFMGQRITVFHRVPFIASDEHHACHIRTAWLLQQFNLEPVREEPGWPALCAVDRVLAQGCEYERIRRWIAERLAEDHPELPISVDLWLVLAESYCTVRNDEFHDAKLRGPHAQILNPASAQLSR